MNVMKQIFDAFEEGDISYVHFKSNMNLRESFEGKADFDVLVDRARLTDVEIILSQNNGKRFNPVTYGRYPGVDNWIVFDDETGILYHLHLHYQIASGKALIKDYVIPWNERIFATRVKDGEFGIYVTNPNLELLLLTVRSVIKSHFSDRLKASIGLYRLHSSLLQEKLWLLERVSEDALRENVSILIPEKYRETVLALAMKKGLSGREFIRLNKAVRRTLKLHRRMSAGRANLTAFSEKVGDVWNKIRARKFDKNVITKKTSLHGGAIIAFVGPDGAGKSTITGDIQKWISRKIECKRFYMGTGDGKTTGFGRVVKSTGGKNSSFGVIKKQELLSFWKQPKAWIRKYLKMLLVVNVEKNNRKKIIGMNQYRINGGISVLDRYPQIEIPVQNDGPKISAYRPYFGDKRILRKLEKKEKRYLSIVADVKPDVIFRLNISAETAFARKDDLDKNDPVAVEGFKKKVEDVKKIGFQGARIIEIDAEQPYEDELLAVKRLIWKEII